MRFKHKFLRIHVSHNDLSLRKQKSTSLMRSTALISKGWRKYLKIVSKILI
jgi:hypothetical protein